MKKKPDHRSIIILAAGGHAKVAIDILLLTKMKILGIVETDPSLIGKKVLGIPVLEMEDRVYEYAPDKVNLVNGLGGMVSTASRQALFEKFKKSGYCFASIVHPSAIIGQEVALSEGAQIMAGVIIQPGTTIGVNSIVNTGVSIDHDCRVGQHVHVAPGVTLCGGVVIEDGAFIGSAAVITPGTIVKKGSFIKAGALVTDHGNNYHRHAGNVEVD